MANSLILNIPHSSSYVPEDDIWKVFLPHISVESYGEIMMNKEKRSIITGRKKAVDQELFVMTDWYTDELFDHSIGKAIITPVSRLVCDVERFSHDEQEDIGMGFCYEKGSRNQKIKDCPAEYKDEILWRYYAPHHIALTDAVESSLDKYDKALIIDCHSFSAEPLPYETEQSNDRPDICIGTDDYHTSERLKETVARFFMKRNLSVEFNNPYSGTIVPLRHYRKDKRVQSIMVELNRNLYLNPGTADKSSEFQSVMNMLFDLEMLLTVGNWDKDCSYLQKP